MSDPLSEITLKEEADALIPDPKVCAELGVTAMTLWRWDRNAELIALGWAPPVYINKRKYRSRRQLEKFKAAMMARAINDRDRTGRKKATA
jgi:hypothetical protein